MQSSSEQLLVDPIQVNGEDSLRDDPINGCEGD